MKIRLRDAYRLGGLWAVLLVVLGFATSCRGASSDNGGRVMYGTPPIEGHEIKAKVVDISGMPIQDIVMTPNPDNPTDSNATNCKGEVVCWIMEYSKDVKMQFRQSEYITDTAVRYKPLDTVFKVENLNYINDPDNLGNKKVFRAQVKVVMQKEQK